MGTNRLQLNAAKIEILWCSSQRLVDQLPGLPFLICDSSVGPSSVVRDPRAYTDRQHVHVHHQGRGRLLRFAIRSVRRSLSHKSFTRLVVALVLSRLDHCNGVLAGLPASQLSRLLVRSSRSSATDPRRPSTRPRYTTAAAASLAVRARTSDFQTLRNGVSLSAWSRP